MLHPKAEKWNEYLHNLSRVPSVSFNLLIMFLKKSIKRILEQNAFSSSEDLFCLFSGPIGLLFALFIYFMQGFAFFFFFNLFPPFSICINSTCIGQFF